MPHHRYLIVGGGMTADSAVRGIRSEDEDGSVGIVSEESVPPYDRPPLSKGLWKGSDEESIWRDTGELGVELHLGRRIVRIDPVDHTATDDRGVIYTWDRLLLATGGRPRRLDDAVGRVVYFRAFDDYHGLRKLAEEGERFAVVGGSFIGSEIAAALAGVGKKVTLIFPEEGICRRVFPSHLSRRLNEVFEEEGVDVRAGVGVASVRRTGDGLLVATEEESTETLKVDGVVAGIGIIPNQELAETAGLEVVDAEEGEGGIVVDGALRTSAADIYAAGDVAAVWIPALGERRRIEHEDQANTTGMMAGRAMAGADVEYDHLPFFYSDLFDLGYEAVGDLDPDQEVVEVWDGDVLGPGALYYLSGGRVRGVALWNLRGKLKEARGLVESGEKLTEEELRSAIEVG